MDALSLYQVIHRITDASFYLSPWKVEITMLFSTSMIEWLTVDIDQT